MSTGSIRTHPGQPTPSCLPPTATGTGTGSIHTSTEEAISAVRDKRGAAWLEKHGLYGNATAVPAEVAALRGLEKHRLHGNDPEVDNTPTGCRPLAQTQEAISAVCDEVKAMLLEKNRKYGNSALKPLRIFSKADVGEQINVRLDDKLSRLASGQTDDIEDTVLDLIGYLILKRVAWLEGEIQKRSGSKTPLPDEKSPTWEGLDII